MRAYALASTCLLFAATACGDDRDSADGGPGSETSGVADDGEEDGSGDGIFDVDPGDGDQELCKVQGEADPPGVCDDSAPPGSFEPDIQWTFDGEGVYLESGVNPLVANLTDDNGDGEIDLCDVPDVVVSMYHPEPPPGLYVSRPGYLYVLDGETGEVHFQISEEVSAWTSTALGDIDGDGLPEIVAVVSEPESYYGNLVAFEHDGTLKWKSPTQQYIISSSALALADMDNDGDVEILASDTLYDHEGNKLWEEQGMWPSTIAPTAADLDDDGDLEFVLGYRAFHHDGSLMWELEVPPTGIRYPHVANLDEDPEPEIFITGNEGLSIIEHDGTPKYWHQLTEDRWDRPAAIHDLDGDGAAELVAGTDNLYKLMETDLSVVWEAPVVDLSGAASGTAFDFLGKGSADAMYADEYSLFVFDATGQPLLDVPRSSVTLREYPVVVDVDNDGSAEVLVVSNKKNGEQSAPGVQVIRDAEDRWVPARRIWNQHTYHVTNVREDGTIPQFEQPWWHHLNTFRTQAQIAAGGAWCMPQEG